MRIETVRDAADLVTPLFQRGNEGLVAIHLDGSGVLNGMSEFAGGPDSVVLPKKDLLTEMVRFGAECLIIAHNHPSGDPAPSDADLSTTRELASVTQALGIRLLDHIIVGSEGRCTSLRAAGLL